MYMSEQVEMMEMVLDVDDIVKRNDLHPRTVLQVLRHSHAGRRRKPAPRPSYFGKKQIERGMRFFEKRNIMLKG